jgi:hypothetical protein
MIFIDTTQFREYFNQEYINIDTLEEIGVKVEDSDRNTSILVMKSKQDYDTHFTIKFKLSFEHKKSKEGKVIQKEFSIEHHPANKIHFNPHLQFRIHGPVPENKVGEMWITLDLDKDDDYVSCIKGFFFILEEVIKKCESGLEEKILDITEVRKLEKCKENLNLKVQFSLKNNKIEYVNPEGEKIYLNPKTLTPILEKDNTLLPFFS